MQLSCQVLAYIDKTPGFPTVPQSEQITNQETKQRQQRKEEEEERKKKEEIKEGREKGREEGRDERREGWKEGRRRKQLEFEVGTHVSKTDYVYLPIEGDLCRVLQVGHLWDRDGFEEDKSEKREWHQGQKAGMTTVQFRTRS